MPALLYKQILTPALSLFTSLGTLVCCALPALLVAVGMGAALTSLISTIPWITAISDYKEYVFGGAGIMLALATFLQWKGKDMPCPADPIMAKICSRARKISWMILGVSILVYGIGFFFAFLAADILF